VREILSAARGHELSHVQTGDPVPSFRLRAQPVVPVSPVPGRVGGPDPVGPCRLPAVQRPNTLAGPVVAVTRSRVIPFRPVPDRPETDGRHAFIRDLAACGTVISEPFWEAAGGNKTPTPNLIRS